MAAKGRGDEAVQACEFQEAAQQADAGGPCQMENKVEGQQEASQEAVTRGTLEESRQFGIEFRMLGLVEPVLESGTRNAGLLGELPLGAGGTVGVMEVVSGLGGIGSIPAEGVWPGVGVGVKLRVSHGPCP